MKYGIFLFCVLGFISCSNEDNSLDNILVEEWSFTDEMANKTISLPNTMDNLILNIQGFDLCEAYSVVVSLDLSNNTINRDTVDEFPAIISWSFGTDAFASLSTEVIIRDSSISCLSFGQVDFSLFE